MDHSPLDNPVWHALGSRHAGFAMRAGQAARYPAEMSPLVGLEARDAPGFGDLRRLVAGGERVGLLTARDFDVPDGWEATVALTIEQLVCEAPPPMPETELVQLGAADVPDMLALVEATRPGPFRARGIEMGRYYGARSPDGRLMAMAGERMRLAGFTEISGVCTWPEFQGRGLAKALVAKLAAQAAAEEQVPFLHVKTQNGAAKAVYERLGFRVRCPFYFKMLQPTA